MTRAKRIGRETTGDLLIQRSPQLARKEDLTQEALKAVLAYDAETGIFTWKVRIANCTYVGDVAGGKNAWGYVKIRTHGLSFGAHRLAWFCVHGVWPSRLIDHINGDPSDNRIANLRDVSLSVNSQNQRSARKDSSTGLLGAHRYRGRFIAKLGVGGRTIRFGVHDTPEAAHAAYIAGKRIHHEGNTL